MERTSISAFTLICVGIAECLQHEVSTVTAEAQRQAVMRFRHIQHEVNQYGHRLSP
jgi:hypothetical protein